MYLINTFTGKAFESLIYRVNELRGLHVGNKNSVVDVLVEMNDGTIVNIEAQKSVQKDFHKRSYFYSSKIASSLLFVSEDYVVLPLVIMLNFLDFTLFKEENFYSKFIKWDEISKNQVIRDVDVFYYIELTKLRRNLRYNQVNLNDGKVRLSLLLDENTPKELVKEVIKMDKMALKIHEKARIVLQNQDEYLAYIRAEQAEQDIKAQIRYAEEKKAMEIAIKLKKLDYPINEIAEITDLSVEEIKKL